MNKILIALLMAGFSSLSFAQTTICNGTPAATKEVKAEAAPADGSADDRFIKTDFDFNCSNNSIVVYEEQNATLLTVGAASVKGNEYFGGHTDGGAVTSYDKCATDPCTADDATTGNTKAAEKASGS